MLGQDIIQHLLAKTILDNIFGTKKGIPVKLDRTKKNLISTFVYLLTVIAKV